MNEPAGEERQSDSREEETPENALDLCGRKCPKTFVHAKLALEELEEEEILTVFVDDPQAVRRMPRNMENHGQEILEVEQVEEEIWKIQIRKKGDGGPKRWILMD